MKRASVFTTLRQQIDSEDTADALRNTIAVVIPIILFFYLGWPITAVGVGVGTLIICMTDLPGNRRDKINTAWVSILLFTSVAMLTSWSTHNTALMIVLMVLLTFSLSMFGVMGNRMFVTGSLAIAVATFTIGLKPSNSLLFASYIFYGGVWYYAISLAQIFLFPHRSLRRAIIETQRATASLMKLRSTGYNASISLIGFNDKNIQLHLKIANQHELVRQLLLTDQKTMQAQDKKSSILLARALNLIDLYEQVSAVHYDYPYLRKTLASTGTLLLIQDVIALFANQLISDSPLFSSNFYKLLEQIQTKAAISTPDQQRLLQQIVINLVEIHDLMVAIQDGYIPQIAKSDSKRYQEFLTISPLKSQNILSQFSLKSPVFRFALRLSLLALVALGLITFFSGEHYSYWILLTMIIVSRPSFSLTIKRNGQRLIGTLLGIGLGWTIAEFSAIPFQLVVSSLFLFGFFVFNRLRYTFSVVCITVAVILCLNAYEGELWNLVNDRILFTILGVAMCFGAAFVFPIWNAPKLNDLLVNAMNGNSLYFQAVMKIKPFDLNSFHQARLARKFSHQQLAILSEAITDAAKEPFRKGLNWSLIKRLQLLNYKSSVLIATLGAMQKTGRDYLPAADIVAIDTNFQKSIAAAIGLNLRDQHTLPKWDNQRMNLLEVSENLARLLKTKVSEVSTSHD